MLNRNKNQGLDLEKYRDSSSVFSIPWNVRSTNFSESFSSFGLLLQKLTGKKCRKITKNLKFSKC